VEDFAPGRPRCPCERPCRAGISCTRGTPIFSLKLIVCGQSLSGIRPTLSTPASALRRNEPTTKSGQYIMKPQFLLCISLFAVCACVPQPSSPPAAAAPGAVQPVSYAAGSSANTTTAYDGTYSGVSVQKVASIMPSGGEGSASCPNYSNNDLPAMTISNGLAQVQALNRTFQGYVAPQGALAMSSGRGQRFEGQIDNQFVLTGRLLGQCTYNLSWRRSA